MQQVRWNVKPGQDFCKQPERCQPRWRNDKSEAEGDSHMRDRTAAGESVLSTKQKSPI